jgi:hypothetical protein
MLATLPVVIEESEIAVALRLRDPAAELCDQALGILHGGGVRDALDAKRAGHGYRTGGRRPRTRSGTRASPSASAGRRAKCT